MVEPFVQLTDLSEAQRTQVLERYTLMRPALDKEISQAQIAHSHHLAPSTVQLWIKQYREKGFAGLTNAARSDKGKPRSLSEQAIQLVEGLALQTPPRSAAAIHRQVTSVAKEQGWKPPSYERVRQIIKKLPPALVTPAHEFFIPLLWLHSLDALRFPLTPPHKHGHGDVGKMSVKKQPVFRLSGGKICY